MGKQPSISRGKPPKKTTPSPTRGVSNHPQMEKRCSRWLPSGKYTKRYGKSRFLKGKSSMSMAIFNSCVSLQEGNHGEL